MRVAISQPRYLPGLNYLQRISITDIFVILDTVQHQRRAFEQRNKIKLVNGRETWLSISLLKKSSRPLIHALKIKDPDWIDKHKNKIEINYKKAPFYDPDILAYIFSGLNDPDFSASMIQMLINLCNLLEIPYHFIRSSSLATTGSGDKLLANITRLLNGNCYISGSNGRNYIKKENFRHISILYHDFNFPTYKQINGDFIPWMSIVDQLFNIGIQETRKIITAKPILATA